MGDDDIRRIVREEIVAALKIVEKTAEPVPYEHGDFERIVLGVLGLVMDKAVHEIELSENGTHPSCPECGARPPKEQHEFWCPHGA